MRNKSIAMGIAAAGLAACMLVGCGAQPADSNPASEAVSSASTSASTAASEQQDASMPAESAEQNTPAEAAAEPDLNLSANMYIEDTSKEPGSAYFKVELTSEEIAMLEDGLLLKGSWVSAEAPEFGVTPLFFLDGESENALIIGLLDDSTALVVDKNKESGEVVSCWTIPTEGTGLQEFTERMLERVK